MQRFSHEAVGNYSVFRVDPSSQTLYVGARDAVLALPLEAIGQQARKVSSAWVSLPPARGGSVCGFEGPFRGGWSLLP